MRLRSLLILLAAAATAACNDGLGPQPWDATPDSIALYSASRADLLGLPSAYDFVNLTPMRVEAPGANGNWDVAVITTNGALQLAPAGSFEGQTSKAAIATITGTTFANLTEAPADTSLYSRSPVTLTAGGVYVVRTRNSACSFTTAVRFAKLQAVIVDATRGLATFAVVRNPYCTERSFVPPKQ